MQAYYVICLCLLASIIVLSSSLMEFVPIVSTLYSIDVRELMVQVIETWPPERTVLVDVENFTISTAKAFTLPVFTPKDGTTVSIEFATNPSEKDDIMVTLAGEALVWNLKLWMTLDKLDHEDATFSIEYKELPYLFQTMTKLLCTETNKGKKGVYACTQSSVSSAFAAVQGTRDFALLDTLAVPCGFMLVFSMIIVLQWIYNIFKWVCFLGLYYTVLYACSRPGTSTWRTFFSFQQLLFAIAIGHILALPIECALVSYSDELDLLPLWVISVFQLKMFVVILLAIHYKRAPRMHWKVQNCTVTVSWTGDNLPEEWEGVQLFVRAASSLPLSDLPNWQFMGNMTTNTVLIAGLQPHMVYEGKCMVIKEGSTSPLGTVANWKTNGFAESAQMESLISFYEKQLKEWKKQIKSPTASA